jgi:hypothetical protein
MNNDLFSDSSRGSIDGTPLVSGRPPVLIRAISWGWRDRWGWQGARDGQAAGVRWLAWP